MLAARDQENLIHAHQTAAAAKTLNQRNNALGARTPAAKPPKTPFRVPLNDENVPYKTGKSVIKGTGKFNKNALVTPTGPARAPLGAKTTNAKAKAFQTPAPLTVDKASVRPQKSHSPRLRRAKVKVLQTEPEVKLNEEEPEIEYAPPPVKDLPYCSDDDFPYDKLESMFSNGNHMSGYYSTFFDPVYDNGVAQSERRFAEEREQAFAEQDKMLQKCIDDMEFLDFDGESLLPKKESVIKNRKNSTFGRAQRPRKESTVDSKLKARPPFRVG